MRCQESDPEGENGVLLSNEIIRMVTRYKLIENFDIKNIKPAGYELRIGNRYSSHGEIEKLKGRGAKIDIKPFDCIIISTEEIINMPGFLIARWNLRVHWVYEGLLWLGAPQVDPCYSGHLFCPIFNLSNKTVTLKKGEPLALIDFVRTTELKTEEIVKQEEWVKEEKGLENKILVKKYGPQSRFSLEDYNYQLESGLFTEVAQKIPDLEVQLKADVNKVRKRLDVFTTIVISLISVLLTTLSIMIAVSAQPFTINVLSFLNTLGLIISIFAIILSIILFLFARFAFPRKINNNVKKTENLVKRAERLVERAKQINK